MALESFSKMVPLHDLYSARLCTLVKFPDAPSHTIRPHLDLLTPRYMGLRSGCGVLLHQYSTLEKHIQVSRTLYHRICHLHLQRNVYSYPLMIPLTLINNNSRTVAFRRLTLTPHPKKLVQIVASYYQKIQTCSLQIISEHLCRIRLTLWWTLFFTSNSRIFRKYPPISYPDLKNDSCTTVSGIYLPHSAATLRTSAKKTFYNDHFKNVYQFWRKASCRAPAHTDISSSCQFIHCNCH